VFIGALVGPAAIADASPITGTVALGATFGVSATTIDFFGNAAFNCAVVGAGVDGCFITGGAPSGSFGALTPGTVGGSIKDLIGPPISGSISLANFMTFNNGIIFDLTTVVPGGAPDCATINGNVANATCTPVIGGQVSPFVLTNDAAAANVMVSFSLQVAAYTGSKATGFSPYQGLFNFLVAGENISQFVGFLAQNGTLTTTYSAGFQSAETQPQPVPEPQTLLLLGTGVVGVLGRSRRALQRVKIARVRPAAR
jgi:hypothetical protein